MTDQAPEYHVATQDYRLRLQNAAGSESVTMRGVTELGMTDLIGFVSHQCAGSDVNWSFGTPGAVETGDDGDTDIGSVNPISECYAMVRRWFQS